jgi:hypothetical protein
MCLQTFARTPFKVRVDQEDSYACYVHQGVTVGQWQRDGPVEPLSVSARSVGVAKKQCNLISSIQLCYCLQDRAFPRAFPCVRLHGVACSHTHESSHRCLSQLGSNLPNRREFYVDHSRTNKVRMSRGINASCKSQASTRGAVLLIYFQCLPVYHLVAVRFSRFLAVPRHFTHEQKHHALPKPLLCFSEATSSTILQCNTLCCFRSYCK